LNPLPRRYRFTTPNVPDTAKIARDHVALLLTHTRCPVEADTARLLVSEVVTNTHQHTNSPIVSVLTTISSTGLRVAVYDTSAVPLPAADDPEPLAEHGRGVLLLRSLATRWGWNLNGSGHGPFGKTVWFELAPRDEASKSPPSTWS
jgi:anti-sigma regulatory factor (Ser/Thr protein kinase)